MRGEPAPYPELLNLAQITGFISFAAKTKQGSETFALNLPVEGLSESDRRKAIASSILPTEQSFLDFVRMLLGDVRGLDVEPATSDGHGSGMTRSRSSGLPGVLESLVKCAADDPERLRSIETAFDDLLTTKNVVPELFRLLWAELHKATSRKQHSRPRRNA